MKKYILTENEIADIAIAYSQNEGSIVALTRNRYQEFPDHAVALTRKQIEDAMGWAPDVAAMRGVLDSLFGEWT